MTAESLREIRHLIDAGDITGARARLGQTEASLKGTPEIAFLTGVCSYREERVAAARSDFETCLHKDPMHSFARYYLALCLEREGAVDQAIEQLRETLRRDPSFKQAETKLGRLGVPTPHPATRESAPPAREPGSRARSAYDLLLEDDSPLSRDTLERIERIRGPLRPTLAGFADLILLAALVGLIVSLVATFFLAYVIGPYRMVPPSICRQGVNQQRVDRNCVEFHGLRKKVDFGSDLLVERFPFVIAGPLLGGGYIYLKYKRTRYEFTTARFEVEGGTLWPSREAIEIVRVVNVNVVRPPIASMLGVATLVLRTDMPSRWSSQLRRRVVLRGIGNYEHVNRLRAELDDLMLDLRRNKALHGILVARG